MWKRKRLKFQELNSLMRQMRMRSKILLGDGLTLPGRTTRRAFQESLPNRLGWFFTAGPRKDLMVGAMQEVKLNFPGTQVSSRGSFLTQLSWFGMKVILSLPKVKGENVILGIFLLTIRKRKKQPNKKPTKIRTLHKGLAILSLFKSKKSQKWFLWPFVPSFISVPLVKLLSVPIDPNPFLGFSLLTVKNIWFMLQNSKFLWLQLKA